jgi:hypothetical protein
VLAARAPAPDRRRDPRAGGDGRARRRHGRGAWLRRLVPPELLPPANGVDVPLAVAIVALGVLATAAPAAVPGLTPAM